MPSPDESRRAASLGKARDCYAAALALPTDRPATRKWLLANAAQHYRDAGYDEAASRCVAEMAE